MRAGSRGPRSGGRSGIVAIALAAASALSLALSGCTPAAPSDAPAPLTAAELSVAYQQLLDPAWQQVLNQHPDAQRPAAEPFREIESDEWLGTVGECLEERGFSVSASAGAYTVSPTLPPDTPDRQQALAVAYFTCDARFPYAGTVERLLSAEERLALFRYYTDFLIPCLESAGVAFERGSARNDQVLRSVHRDGFWAPTVLRDGDSPIENVGRICPPEPSWRR